MISPRLPVLSDLWRMVFPQTCPGCGIPVTQPQEYLCFCCLATLPETGYWKQPNNPLEQQFWGRLPLLQAHACLFFSEKSITASLLKRLKYRGEEGIGLFLGRHFANRLSAYDSLFIRPDVIVPMPLHPKRQRLRGFNQSALIAAGMAQTLLVPVRTDVIVRRKHNVSQTTRSVQERWQNVSGIFHLSKPHQISNLHVLLVDDVITTGSTLESCGQVLLHAPGIQLSVAALATAFRND